jgi:hypothetical protein
MKKVKAFLPVIIFSAVLISCAKDGATGPAGANGATGPAGPAGPIGPGGATGSANVIYSNWITSPYSSRDTTVDGTCLRIRHLDAPSLSAAILDKGTMITYMRVGSIGPYALPYTSDAGGATNTVNCIYNQQKIFVYRHTFNTCRFNSGIAPAFPGQPVLVNLPQSLEYRYILIPGAVSGGRFISGPAAGYTSDQLKAMPYEQIRNLMKIPAEGTNEVK